MTKSLYLLLLLLLGLQFFNLVFFAPLFSTQFAYPVLLAAWLYYGYYKWGKGQSKFFKKELKYWKWMLIGICSSMLPIYINIGQNILHSLWIYRNILIVYCSLPVLLFIRFSYKEIIDTTFKFSIIYAIIFVVVIMFPSLKRGTINENGELKVLADTDFGYTLEGIEFMLFPLYSYLAEYVKSHKKKIFYRIIFILTLLFFIQNRSVLFPAMLISIVMLWRGFSNAKRFLMLIIAVSILFVPSLNPFQSLIEQTERETQSEDYNRNLSYAYFMEKNFSSFQQFLCGTGTESTHLSRQKEKLENMALLGVHPSDVGFFGFMYLYGIIPIIIFTALLFKPLIRWKRYPIDLRCMAIHILICVTTISYFEAFPHTIWFFLYLTTLSFYQTEHCSSKQILFRQTH